MVKHDHYAGRRFQHIRKTLFLLFILFRAFFTSYKYKKIAYLKKEIPSTFWVTFN